MRIAVTYEAGQVFQHFGHCKLFKIYDVQDNKVNMSIVIDAKGSRHGALAGFLQAYHVDVLICGGIGGGAQNALNQAGIKFYGGVTGSADAAVDAFLAGTLAYDPDARCDHHDHGCGGHDCASGHCH